MKHRDTNRTLESHGTSKASFSIKSSGKMFHMVISGLYSDKPQSITREIYSNAFDAHAMVGKSDTPFDVIYPTPLSPTFTVRDYGPGIAHEDMEGFYTVIGHSTKEDTNDAVGKWGVGRMSPMSYKDSFTVVSRHKGKMGYYNVALGPDGEPQLHTMHLGDADGPDGLEVSFTIDRHDIHEFAEAARRMVLGMDTPPNVLNSDEADFEQPEVTVEGDRYRFFQHADFRGYTQERVFAKMGCVMYPIKNELVPSNLRNKNMIIDFPIGDLDVTASREGLSYDEETTRNIQKAMDHILEDLDEKIKTEVSQAKTHFEACVSYHNICSAISRWPDMEWNGYKIKSVYLWANYDFFPWSSVDTGNKSVRCYWEGQGESRLSFHVGNAKRLYIQNVAKKVRDVRAGERVLNHEKERLQATNQRNYQVDNRWIRADLSDPLVKANVDELVATIKDHIEVIYVKDIPDPGAPASARRPVKIKVANPGERYWEDGELDDGDFKAGGVWMPISNNQPVDGYCDWQLMSAAVEYLKKFNNDKLVVVPKTHWKKFEEAGNWTELKVLAKKEATKDVKKKMLFSVLDYNHQVLHNYLRLELNNKLHNKIKQGKMADDQKMNGLSRRRMRGFLRIYYQRDQFPKNPAETLVEYIDHNYPLLKCMSSFSAARLDKQAFVEYVNMVDSTKANQSIAA